MPYLRDKLADHLDHPPLPFHHVTDYQRELAGAWSSGDGLRHSPMWWVSRDMTTLAVHTALHEAPPEVNPPSATGFILFDGGLDLTGAPDAPLAHIVGLRWIVETSADGVDHVGMEMFSDDPGVCELMQCPLPLVPMPRSVAVDAAFAREANVFERVLRAVWALSAEPTVCTVDRPDRPDGLEPLPPPMDPPIRQRPRRQAPDRESHGAHMATMNLDEAIAAYLLPYDEQTYAQYKKALHAWLRWCDLNDIDPMRVTRTHIEAYSRWLGRQHTIATVRDIAGAVCRFYAFLADELVLDHNPAAAVRLPRKHRHSPGGFLTREQAHGLRRTFCTLALDAGMAERDIMAACGWGTPAMVAYYDMANRAVTQQVGDGVAGLIGL